MPALPKPYRIAVLVPAVSLEGADAAFEREAAALLWTACLEICQRHPRLSVLDADATPLFPQDGHFAPEVGRGSRPSDAFFAPTRRDELIWLELSLGAKPGIVRLVAVGRDGKQESFDALGPSVGEQIQQVLGAWLTARSLGPLPRRFEEVTAEEVLAMVRVLAPTLAEQARAWSLPVATKPTWSLALVEADDEDEGDPIDDDPEPIVIASTIDSTLDLPAGDPARRRSIARPLANRLPSELRVPALRLLELALREDLGDLILASDPEHPQALLARFERSSGAKDFALVRRVIASAPGWARPYELLSGEGADAPSAFETLAAAGIAAVCRPGNLEVLEVVAALLDDSGRTDDSLRMLERAVAQDGDNPRAHLALLDVHRETGRIGAWLAQATRSASQHGCPMDPVLPWYPDQIHIDLRVSTALLHVGRLDEAIALRANRLDGREAAWPAQTRALQQWRKDPRFVAWCYAREGYFRGDDARAVEGFGRIEPDDSVDLAIFLDALVALGHENEVPLAWAQFGLGRRCDGPVARIAAARALMAAGDYRRGLEEMWRFELTEPGRDDHLALARCGVVMSGAPIDVIEAALAERIAIGAPTLARRMARDAADYVPAAAKSALVARALGKHRPVDFDPSSLDGFSPHTRSKKPIDQLFAELGPLRKVPPSGFDISDELKAGDRLVNRWLEVVFAEASEDDRPALAQAAAYTAAQAVGRYLAATTALPSTIAGALRTVAGEALGLVRRHRDALGDRDVRALLRVLDPLLRRADRWIGARWLASVERAVGLDERSIGDVAGFARDSSVVAARIAGPEEGAVLAWTVARLHRDRPDGWAAKVAVQAGRLATTTGQLGYDEWADAIVDQLAKNEIELDDAIDSLHVACYLAEGKSPRPCVHAARILFGAGRAAAALAVLTSGMRAAEPAWRARELASLAELWQASRLDVPFELAKVTAGVLEALQKGDAARAEKLARWAVACDPDGADAHRDLGLALASQGKIIDAMAHLVRGTRDEATQLLSSVLYQSGMVPEAMAVLDYASRWYVRADQWLTFGGIAYAAMDNPRTVKAYGMAYQLDPDAFDHSMLSAYAGVLAEVGDHAACERVASRLLELAGDDLTWKTNAWNHLACARIAQGNFDEAVELATRAIEANPQPDNTAAFAATFSRAMARNLPAIPESPGQPREPALVLLEAGEHAAAAALYREGSWRGRRAALHATRFRLASENSIEVPLRARAAAASILADTCGTMDREALLARALALQVRAQAYLARDPVPRLGDRLTREAFHHEFRARGGVALGADVRPPAAFVDRVVVPGGKVERASDYIALLRDLAALAPPDALAQFGLDEGEYLEIARAWALAMEQDPTIARTVEAGLAER